MDFLLVLGIVTVSCLALGLISKYLRQASIPAYIIAGILFRYSSERLEFGLISSYDFAQVVQGLGKIGIILLMFYIGHEFNFRGIKEPGRFFAGCTDFGVNFIAGFSLGLLIGLSLLEAFILASAVYISSSAIVISSLIENKRLIYPEAETVVWLMVFEDIILAILLVVLTSITSDSLAMIMIPVSLAKTLLLIVFILVLIRGLSNFISPLFERDDEIPILLIFALIFGFSALAHLLTVSEVIVAFFLGSALSGVKPFKKLLGDTISFKNLFLTIFFFSFGMMFSFEFAGLPLTEFVLALLALITLSILGKFVSGALIGKKQHGSLETGLRVGAYTTPRGEFSVVLLAVVLGMEMGISELLFSLVVAYVIFLSLIGSFIAKHGDRIGKAMTVGINKLMTLKR